MNDQEAIGHALAAVGGSAEGHSLVKRNGRPFMALPANRLAALHTLGLYQPQRLGARCFTCLMRIMVLSGLHQRILRPFRALNSVCRPGPFFIGCTPDTAGLILGSPEHRVRRAIVSYQSQNGWEVAKLAAGPEGREVINGEAATLNAIPKQKPAVPTVLGVHHGESFSMLRMPYVSGRPVAQRDISDAINLLHGWISDDLSMPTTEFPEWDAIQSALGRLDPSGRWIADLEENRLLPVLRHGDFARWNLVRQRDGRLMALDWEWGHPRGMPGLDLVHLHLQVHRLVRRLTPRDAIQATIADLERPACRSYLRKTGWPDDLRLPIVASLAWKQGAGHQDNATILGEALLIKPHAKER